MDTQETGTAAVQPMQEPRVQSRPAFKVAGMLYVGKNEKGEIPELWDRFCPYFGRLVPDVSQGFEAFGVSRMSPGLPPGEFEYLASVGVPSFEGLPEGIVGWQIPEQTYAVFQAKGIPELLKLWGRVFGEWLPRSTEYVGADGPCFELYPPTFSEDEIIYIYCPVKPK